MSRAPWPGCHGGQKWLGARPAARGPHWSSAHHPPPPSSCPAKVCLYLPPPQAWGELGAKDASSACPGRSPARARRRLPGGSLWAQEERPLLPGGHSCAHGRSPRAARQLRGRHLGPGPGAGAAPRGGTGSRRRAQAPQPRRLLPGKARPAVPTSPERMATPRKDLWCPDSCTDQHVVASPARSAAGQQPWRLGCGPECHPRSRRPGGEAGRAPLRARSFQGAFRARED